MANEQRPNRLNSQEPAEGSRENVNTNRDSSSDDPKQPAGITNRPLDQEKQSQEEVPPRGMHKEDV
jgi:hypothetical protein